MFGSEAISSALSCKWANVVPLPAGQNVNMHDEAVKAAVPAGEDVLFVVPWGVAIGSTDAENPALKTGNLSAYGACRLLVIGEVQGAGGHAGHFDLIHAAGGVAGRALMFGDGGHGGDALKVSAVSTKLEVEVHALGALRAGGGGGGMKNQAINVAWGPERYNKANTYWQYQGVVRWNNYDPFGEECGAFGTGAVYYEDVRATDKVYQPLTWHRLDAKSGIRQGTRSYVPPTPVQGTQGKGFNQAKGSTGGDWGQKGVDGGNNPNILWAANKSSGAMLGAASWDTATGEIWYGKTYKQGIVPPGAVKIGPWGGRFAGSSICWREPGGPNIPDPTKPYRLLKPHAGAPMYLRPANPGVFEGIAQNRYGLGGDPGHAIASPAATVPLITGGVVQGDAPTAAAPGANAGIVCVTLPTPWVRTDIDVLDGTKTLEQLAAGAGVAPGGDIRFRVPAGTIIGTTDVTKFALKSGDLSAYGTCRLVVEGQLQGAGGAAPAAAGGTTAGSALHVTTPLEVEVASGGAIRGGGGGSAPVDTFGPWENHARTGTQYYTNYSHGPVDAAMWNNANAMPAAGRPARNSEWIGPGGHKFHVTGPQVNWGFSGHGAGIGRAEHLQHPGEVGQGYHQAKTATGGAWGVAPPGGGHAGSAIVSTVQVPFGNNGVINGNVGAVAPLPPRML